LITGSRKTQVSTEKTNLRILHWETHSRRRKVQKTKQQKAGWGPMLGERIPWGPQHMKRKPSTGSHLLPWLLGHRLYRAIPLQHSLLSRSFNSEKADAKSNVTLEFGQ
jgi:hypothetical protein